MSAGRSLLIRVGLACFWFSICSLAASWFDSFSRMDLGPEWTGETNAFRVADGVLQGESGNPVAPSPLNILETRSTWSNFVVSCSINILRPNLRVCTKGALLLRHSSEDGYVFALHEATQTIELYRLSNHEMLLSKSAALSFSNWYRVKAEVREDTLSLWLNSVFVGMVRDRQALNGSAGVAVQDADVIFDDFNIRETALDEPRPFMLHLSILADGKLQFTLFEGSLVNGQWFLEMSDNLNSWRRLGPFSAGNVAAFAQDLVPAGDLPPRFYRAVLVER